MTSVRHIHVPHYTYEEYKQWEGRWELIHGIPYALSPAPSIRHQQVNGNLFAEIQRNLSSCEHCQALIPIDWRIADDIVVQPDVSIICYPATGNYIEKPPVLVFEILSASTKDKDRIVKYELYERAGVKYYVIVDPDIERISAFELRDTKYVSIKDQFSGTAEFAFGSCRLTIDFSAIWPSR